MKPKNIFYKSNVEIREYHSKKQGPRQNLFIKDWEKQSEKLLMEIKMAFENSTEEIKAKNGKYLEIIGVENTKLKVSSLKDDRSKVKVLKTESIIENSEDMENIKDYQKALIYLPESKKDFLNKKIQSYIENEGRKQNNLINSIFKIKNPSLESFWSGEVSEIPDKEEKWCEFWIEKNSETRLLIEKIKRLGIDVREKFLQFEERDIILCKVDKKKILKIINEIDGVCEIKLKSDFSIEAFFDLEDRKGQYEWIKDLKERTEFKDKNASILLIDSGINNAHPLLENFVKNCSGVNRNDISDKEGHGTGMAGLALYKDLAISLERRDKVEINHTLQSHKIFYKDSKNEDLFGSMTMEAIVDSLDLPNQINCMAIASKANIFNGTPTSWSAAIDELCFGDILKPEGRIFCLSAGNINEIQINDISYPELNEISCIEDPGQSWNSLTIGGYTAKYLENSKYKIVAEPFTLSPFSKTSCLWNSKDGYKLIKPEVLFEAGNKLIYSSNEYYTCDNLSLLSTNAKFRDNYFTSFNGTSAATALAANFCAKITTKYPEAWPQTIRGLVVHSAELTEQMKNKFLKDNTKTSYGNLLRVCGYGIPNLDRALGVLKNSANLIIQSEIKPFKLLKDRIIYDELHVHELPWPVDILKEYSDKKFKIKVTLSYFIEPNPGNFKGIYDYQSYGLRFEFCGNRSKEELIRKVSKVDDISYKDNNSDNWLYGPANRNVGSIHSDIWEGSGADFSEARYILIYPVGGWWKQKKKSQRYNKKVKYSLIVSITSEEEKIDLYTPIYNSIENLVKNKIEIKFKR